MLRSLYKHVGRDLWNFPSIYPQLIRIGIFQSGVLANSVRKFLKDHYIKQLESPKYPSKDKLVDLIIASYFRFPLSESMKNFTQQFPEIFSIEQDTIRISRLWLEALQEFTEVSFFPESLFKISKKQWDVYDYADLIHEIHKATYNILEYKKIPPTIELIYRGAAKDPTRIELDRKLDALNFVEYDTADIEGIKHFRCCAIKPHGCENYDFDDTKNAVFILARGMDMQGVNSVCAMPTALFSFHDLPLIRYKGNIEPEELIMINFPKLKYFFYLFEPILPKEPIFK